MRREIRLRQAAWSFDTDQLLGKPGNFGEVFLGKSEKGEEVAVKRIKFAGEAHFHRESRIADELLGKPFNHVIPVFDSGRDAESDQFFLVMPKADYSLKDTLDGGKTFDSQTTSSILLQIATGLEEVKELVHRDLKPANILFHEGRWKVADFGIARFLEESTASETLKKFRSNAYAAPEQWEKEHAVSETDIYALGCIGYALLTGKPPFNEDHREKHLHSEPPPLVDADPRLASLLLMMLRKNPGTRPSRARVLTLLADYSKTVLSNAAPQLAAESELAKLGRELAEKEANAEATQKALLRDMKERTAFAAEANRILEKDIVEELSRRIRDSSPMVKEARNQGSISLSCTLGEGYLHVLLNRSMVVNPRDFGNSKWDVIKGASIYAFSKERQTGRGASLWFAKLPGVEEYRWYEVSYFNHPLSGKQDPNLCPFPLTDAIAAADRAASSAMDVYQIAFGPRPIDYDSLPDFCERWLSLFAQAANGTLERPRRLPLD